jgi:hypothetical protein
MQLCTAPSCLACEMCRVTGASASHRALRASLTSALFLSCVVRRLPYCATAGTGSPTRVCGFVRTVRAPRCCGRREGVLLALDSHLSCSPHHTAPQRHRIIRPVCRPGALCARYHHYILTHCPPPAHPRSMPINWVGSHKVRKCATIARRGSI